MYNKYGLTDEQVIEKRKKYGSNTISNSKGSLCIRNE